MIRITTKQCYYHGTHPVSGAVGRESCAPSMGRQRCHPFSQPLELEARRKVVRKHTSGEYGAQGCWRPAEAPGGSIHCLVSMGRVRGREARMAEPKVSSYIHQTNICISCMQTRCNMRSDNRLHMMIRRNRRNAWEIESSERKGGKQGRHFCSVTESTVAADRAARCL